MKESFESLVKRMREAQKKYFKNKTLADLKYAKELEYEVDRRIEELTVGIDLFCNETKTEVKK